MSAVALIYLEGARVQPSPDVLAPFAQVQEFEIQVGPGQSRISRAGVIATGVPARVHGVDSAQVLDVDPLRVRPRAPGDCRVPWIWDVVREAGLRAAVIGWPGISVVRGSLVPMVSEHALAWGSAASEHWPLAGLFVEPEDLREAVARNRVAPSALRPDELPSFPDTELEGTGGNGILATARSVVSRARTALGALEALVQEQVDLVTIALHVPASGEAGTRLGAYVLDLVLPRLGELLEPDSFILTIATQGHLGRCMLAGPRILEGDSSGVRGIDITPSVLALLGVDRPGHVEGRDLTSSDDGARRAFVMPTTPLEHPPDIEILVEAIERDDLEHLPARRRPPLRRFAVRALRRQWMDARIRFDFKAARSCAHLLVRLDASATNLWWLAFSCDRYGDIEGVHEASRQLLEGYPGSAEAILSAVLGTRQATPDQLRTIVDAIDPSTLAYPSMQATWARSAIKAGMVDAGIEVFEKLVRSGLSVPMDRVALSAALQSRGDSERALAILGRLGSAPTATLNVRILRANVLLGAGRIDEARAVASAILEAYPLEKRATTILAQTSDDDDPGSMR